MSEDKKTLFITVLDASREELNQLHDTLEKMGIMEDYLPVISNKSIYAVHPAELVNALHHIYQLADIPMGHIGKQLPETEFDEFRFHMRQTIRRIDSLFTNMVSMIENLQFDIVQIHQASPVPPAPMSATRDTIREMKHQLQRFKDIAPKEAQYWGREQDIRKDRKAGKYDDEESTDSGRVQPETTGE